MILAAMALLAVAMLALSAGPAMAQDGPDVPTCTSDPTPPCRAPVGFTCAEFGLVPDGIAEPTPQIICVAPGPFPPGPFPPDVEPIFVGPAIQEFEIEEAESGDAAPSLEVSNTGDSVNQCVGALQSANTGNVQNIQGVNQVGGEESDDIEFEGSSITISPELELACDQTIQQAAAAGWW